MNNSFALVRILNAANNFDKEYNYYILPEQREKVHIGTMCTVPYGMANKLRTGVIVGLSNDCEYPNVKPLSEIFEYPVTLDKEGVELCNFIKERTVCTFGAAFRAVIPSGQEIETGISYQICYEADIDSLNDKAKTLYEYISEHGIVKESILRTEFGDDIIILLNSLEKMKVIHSISDSISRINEKKCFYYRLASTDEAVDAADDPERLQSEKQRIIVGFLRDGGIITASEAQDMFNVSSSVLAALVKKNIIEKFEKRSDRNYIPHSNEIKYADSELSPEQSAAFETISGLMESGEPKAALLYGVTGSGKTRVIIEACKKAISMGKQAIVLLPEIGLTSQAVGVFRHAFGEKMAVLHSMLSIGERLDTCRNIKDGKIDVVIGTRSAIFAPFSNLGLIAIDEEQEHTYKSENTPKYHARDIARFRCNYNKCLMLLCSATPSVESYYKAEKGIYTLIKMINRYGKSVLPECEIADIRNDKRISEGKMLSLPLYNAIKRSYEKGNQAILFVNRRGYNSHLSCLDCGYVYMCPNCSVSMTYHVYGDALRKNKLVCHYCGYVMTKPEVCPSCGKEHLGYFGYGTQKLQEELDNDLPELKCVRMDADTTTEKHSHEEIIESFARGEYNVLFGTHMISKGLDFPKVDLVGIISADANLYMNDFRAGERTFSLFTQLAGRSGRSENKGRALFQTFSPDNEILRLAMTQDYEMFYSSEIAIRKAVLFPPFCDIAVFTFASETEHDANAAADSMNSVLIKLKDEKYPDMPIIKLGPYHEGIFRLRNRYRQRIIIKYRDRAVSRSFLTEAYNLMVKLLPKVVKVDIEINPIII